MYYFLKLIQKYLADVRSVVMRKFTYVLYLTNVHMFIYVSHL